MFTILTVFPIERTHEEVKRVEQTFGSFLREKRMARGLTLRGMAAKLDLSPVYMSNIENDRRAAPSQEYLERMALLLQLDKPEREWMLDLAAKSKQNRVAFSHPPEVGQRAVHPKLSAVLILSSSAIRTPLSSGATCLAMMSIATLQR